MLTADNVPKNYIFNFVLDFLNISNETLKHFYNIEKKIDKKRDFLSSWKMHEEHKAKHYVSSINTTIKYQYQMKKRKRNVYLKK